MMRWTFSNLLSIVNYMLMVHVKLYTELKTATDESCFQDCLDLLYSWSVTWQLAISSKKCCIATIGKLGDSWGKPKYCLGVEHISVSDTVSDLGVIVDSHLSFSQHGTHGTINSFIHRKKSLAGLINEPT